MSISIDAIYENGAFRPLLPNEIALSEGQRVHLRVEAASAVDVIELASKVYDGLSPDEIDEIERIALDRSNFFGRRSVDP